MGTTMSVNVEVGFRKEPSEEIVSVYDVRAGIKIDQIPVVKPPNCLLSKDDGIRELDAAEPGCDTDLDGIDDDEELGERVEVSDGMAGVLARVSTNIIKREAKNTAITFEWESDPTKADTDGVGFDDGEEVEPTVDKREPSNPKKVELFYAALNPLVVVDDDNNRPITLDELKSEPYNADVIGPGLLNRFVMIGRSAPGSDSEVLVPMDMVLQSTSSDPPSVEYDTGVSTTNRDENTALTISPRYEAGETLFVGGA
jgi:hypothetical protein